VRAKLFLFDRLFTHFERAENAKDLRSKLEDDLARLHDILTRATSRSIVILNEILSSATLQDAIYLSGNIMERIDGLDALCVWVTFIDEIIGRSAKTVSMISEMEPGNLAVRTFKVVRKPADGLAYALAIAEKYHVTYKDLHKRLPS
jgi:DNA mismatch repair ATPase MutS